MRKQKTMSSSWWIIIEGELKKKKKSCYRGWVAVVSAITCRSDEKWEKLKIKKKRVAHRNRDPGDLEYRKWSGSRCGGRGGRREGGALKGRLRRVPQWRDLSIFAWPEPEWRTTMKRHSSYSYWNLPRFLSLRSLYLYLYLHIVNFTLPISQISPSNPNQFDQIFHFALFLRPIIIHFIPHLITPFLFTSLI